MILNQSDLLISNELLETTFGQSFLDQEISEIRQKIQVIEPPPLKQFWNSQNAQGGIYIIVTGKVRLTCSQSDRPLSLKAGESFGELTLFPQESFESYSAKATRDVLKLCFISGDNFLKLSRKYPKIREHLHHQAVLRDSLLTGTDATLANENKSHKKAAFLDYTLPIEPKNQKKISKAYFPSPTLQVGHLWQGITRRYPFFAQQSGSDCGAASLVMVASYWGKRFSVNRLRDMANVDRNGASLRGLSAAAESIGFSTRPVKASLDQLAKQNLPAIAHWEGKHYVVVYEITRKHVIVGDPAIGQSTLTHSQFKAGWTGYALLLQPTALIKDAQEYSTPFWQIFELAKPHGLVLFEVFIASVFIQIFGLIAPLFTQIILDNVVKRQSQLTLAAFGMGLLIFSLFRVAMTGLRQYLLDQTANRVDLALIVGFIRHTFRLPLSFFESRYVGDIISRVQENHKIQRFLTGEALSILLDLLTVFIYVGLMLWYSWKMALLALLIIPPFVLLALIATPFLQKTSREIFNSLVGESSYLIEALTGVRTVKSLAVEQTVRWHWEELLNKSVKSNFAGQVIGNRLQIFSGAIEAVVTTGLLWFGAGLVIQGELTPGQLVAFNMLLGNVIRPFQRLTVLWNQVQEVVIAIERIHDVIETEPEEDLQQQSRQNLPPIKGHIRFDKVTLLKKCKRYKHASTSLYTNSSPKKGGVELVNKLCLQVATKSNTTIKNVQLGRYAAKPLQLVS